MKKLTCAAFAQMVGGLFIREDNEGFECVWGYLIDEEQRTVTFWRRKAAEEFQFKFLETYVIPTPLTEKEDEKEAKGYERLALASSHGRKLMGLIRPAYVHSVQEGIFHFTPHV